MAKTAKKISALKKFFARPNTGIMVSSVAMTLGLLAVAWAFGSMGATRGEFTRNPYYVARFNAHGKGYGDGCADCHKVGFAEVSSRICIDCHHDYAPGYDRAADPEAGPIYPADWSATPDQDRAARAARVHAAHLRYHALPVIAQQDCAACHREHQPIPENWEFEHAMGTHVIPDGIMISRCVNCHGAEQVPPTEPHQMYFDNPNTDQKCWDCHKHTDSWEFQVVPTASAQ